MPAGIKVTYPLEQKKGSTHRLVLYTLEAGGLLILRSNYLLVAVLQAYKNDQALNKKGISTQENCAAVLYYFELYNYLNIKK